MNLRFSVPFAVLIIGPSPESLGYATKFKRRGLWVEVVAEGDAPLHSDEMPADQQHFRLTRELAFVVSPSDETEAARLTGMVNDKLRWGHLVLVLISITNRVLRSVRNFGCVPNINEVKSNEENLEAFMQRWKVFTFRGRQRMATPCSGCSRRGRI